MSGDANRRGFLKSFLASFVALLMARPKTATAAAPRAAERPAPDGVGKLVFEDPASIVPEVTTFIYDADGNLVAATQQTFTIAYQQGTR